MQTAYRIWLRQGREIGFGLLDLVLAAACPACGALADGLCRPCTAGLLERSEPCCRRCGEQVLAPGEPCPADHRFLRGLSWARAPYRFAGTGGALVRAFKLRADLEAGRRLARAMVAALRPELQAGWRRAILVPVPLHPEKRRRRGFDQAAWLAEQVARPLRLSTKAGSLARIRATLPQGDPRVTSREQNVTAAFVLRRPHAIAGAAVILLDDVCTSGATARACASVLRAGGAADVALVTACQS